MNDTLDEHRRRWLTGLWVVVMGALLLIVAGSLYVWFGPGPAVPARHLRWSRREGGQFKLTGGGRTAPAVNFKARAEATSSNTSLSSSRSTYRSGAARFACRRVAVFNQSEHPLVALAALRLVESLKRLPYVHTIDYWPPGERPPDGQRMPDICIRLDLESLDGSERVISRSLDARLTATAGSSWTQSRHGHIDRLTPPVLNFNWRGRLQCRSKSSGIASASARYDGPAADIGGKLGKSLAGTFDDYYEKDGPLPELPRDFYPAWREPAELPFLDRYGARRVCSWHGLMTRNETFWRIQVPGDAADALSDIRDRMKSDGWTVDNFRESDEPYLRLSRDAAAIEVFRERDTSPSRRPQESAGPGDAPTVFYVRYLDRMGAAELRKAIDTTLTEDAPTDLLLTFRSIWNAEQRQRAVELLERRRPASPEAWLAISEFHGDDRPSEARRALLNAHVLTRTVTGKATVRSRIRRRAKELGMHPLSGQPVSPERFRELGFRRVEPGQAPVEVEVGPDEPASFFAGGDGEPVTASVRVARWPRPDGQVSYVARMVTVRGGSRSWTEQPLGSDEAGFEHRMAVGGGGGFVVRVRRVPGRDRFRVTATVQ